MKMMMFQRLPSPIIIISVASWYAGCGAFGFGPSRRIATTTLPTTTTLQLQPQPPRPSRALHNIAISTDHHEQQGPSPETTSSSDEQSPSLFAPLDINISLESCASSGIECGSDLPRILDAVSSACEGYGIPCNLLDDDDARRDDDEIMPFRSSGFATGALGRVLLLRVGGMKSDDAFDIDEHDGVKRFRMECSKRINAILHGDDDNDDGISNDQPILLAFLSEGDGATIGDIIEREILDHGLRDEMNDVCSVEDGSCFVHPYQMYIYSFPSSHIEIDGAVVEKLVADESHDRDDGGEQHQEQHYFDTRSILVLDKILVDASLRKRLLNVAKGLPEEEEEEDRDDEWDDVKNGPDPKRWVRNTEETRWGLNDEATKNICHNEHPAIAEFESKLVELFPDFIVSRISTAVLGRGVPPLTANASTSGDEFDYHIDADPLCMPPSPWVDIYGRYPNRSAGKPRFVSCILYLNDKWDADKWGAPIQFLDPPTKETYKVFPKPGRCVIMDQDVTYRDVAPNAEAGKQPLYTLVWKLVLHPTEEGQDMDLSCGRQNLWPEPIVIGSANR